MGTFGYFGVIWVLEVLEHTSGYFRLSILYGFLIDIVSILYRYCIITVPSSPSTYRKALEGGKQKKGRKAGGRKERIEGRKGEREEGKEFVCMLYCVLL